MAEEVGAAVLGVVVVVAAADAVVGWKVVVCAVLSRRDDGAVVSEPNEAAVAADEPRVGDEDCNTVADSVDTAFAVVGGAGPASATASRSCRQTRPPNRLSVETAHTRLT